MRNKFCIAAALAVTCVALACAPAFAADAAIPQVIEIHAKRYEFVPAEITLKKGVPVRIKLDSDDVLHSLKVPGLQLNAIAEAGKSVEADITPTETGDFKGECGKFCGVGHGKMKFVVHVVVDAQ